MKGDLKQLQGIWNIVSLEVEGDEYPPLGSRIAIAGDRFVSLNMGAEYEGAMMVNESATPKTLDMLYDKGPHVGKKSLGIYELKKDEWKICLGLAGSARPEKFVTKKGTGHALEVLHRGAVAASPVAASPVKVAVSSASPTQLEGEWSMTSCIQNGKPIPKSSAAYARRVFQGDQTTLYIGPQASSQTRFTLAGPNIDYVDLGQTGTFELSEKSLKISMTDRGSAGRTVTEWKRKA